MFRSTLIALISTLFLSVAVAQAPETQTPEAQTPETQIPEGEATWVQYGNEFTVQDAPIAAKDLLANPGEHTGKTVVVEGRIADVCQKAGCWLVLAEGDKSIRVLTKAHKFFVAKDSTGQTCRIEGVVNAKDIDPETVAHFESESANKDVIPERSATDGKTFELVASGIQIQRVAAD